jgi:large subunit ribosomal protein L9
MKLILLTDVKPLGKRGDLVDVAEGYGRNFLLPRKLAAEADRGALAAREEQTKARHKRDAQTLAEAQSLAQRLQETPFSIAVKAGGNGKLFGAITNADVAGAISRALDVTVDKHKIGLKEAIKSLGTYPIEIKLHRDVVAKATVNVVAM